MTQSILLPAYLTSLECAREVEDHLADYFPGIQEDLNIDCVIRRKCTQDQNEITVIAAKTAYVNTYLRAAAEAGSWLK